MGLVYQQKLRDRRWQQRRLKIFERDGWVCKHPDCRDRQDLTVPLCVHHLVYYPDTDPWDYDDEDLVTWCERCHDRHHRGLRQAELGLAA